jgi:hypothetical protein
VTHKLPYCSIKDSKYIKKFNVPIMIVEYLQHNRGVSLSYHFVVLLFLVISSFWTLCRVGKIVTNWRFRLYVVYLFSSPGPKVQVNYCHHLASVVCRPSSVNFSHFKLLLRNHWANWNQISRNVPWMVLYKVTVFRSSRIFNMAARANNMLWLAEISKIFFSETNELTEPKL